MPVEKFRHKIIEKIAERFLVISKKLFDTISSDDFELAAKILVWDDEAVEDTRSYEEIVEEMTPIEKSLYDLCERMLHRPMSAPTPDADGMYTFSGLQDHGYRVSMEKD